MYSVNIRNLSKEYLETDSISKKEEIADIISDYCAEFLRKKYELYKKYSLQGPFKFNDYLPDRGSLKLEDICGDKIVCQYEDYCRGSRYCSNIDILFVELEAPDYFGDLECQMILQRLANLQYEQEQLTKKLEFVNKEIIKLNSR